MALEQDFAFVLTLIGFSVANFGLAAALRTLFKWPGLRERTLSAAAALVFTWPFALEAVRELDVVELAIFGLAFFLYFQCFLAGLRIARPK